MPLQFYSISILDKLAFLILITLSHSLFHHTNTGYLYILPIVPRPPFPGLFLFILLGMVSSNFSLINWIRFLYLSFTPLSLFHPLFAFSSVIFCLSISMNAVQSVSLLCCLQEFLLPFLGSVMSLYSMEIGTWSISQGSV
jgi:hypothetical protein